MGGGVWGEEKKIFFFKKNIFKLWKGPISQILWECRILLQRIWVPRELFLCNFPRNLGRCSFFFSSSGQIICPEEEHHPLRRSVLRSSSGQILFLAQSLKIFFKKNIFSSSPQTPPPKGTQPPFNGGQIVHIHMNQFVWLCQIGKD